MISIPLIMLALSVSQPYRAAPGLFDQSATDLGLKPAPGLARSIVHSPSATEDRFSNGAVPIGFKGRIFVQWQSSAKDEDSPDTRILFVTSGDGQKWTNPQLLFPSGEGGAMHSNGGWWTDGETLVAFINVWPSGFQSGVGGYTLYMTSRDGTNWSAPARVTNAHGEPVDGVIEQDPHAMPGGRVVGAFHLSPGVFAAPHYTDDPLAVSGWTRGAMTNLPFPGRTSRELEPSLFRVGDCIVMVFRDQASSYRQLAAESCDRGASWSSPALTNFPDSRSKQSAGNLPDGTAYIVNAPNAGKLRMPLALSIAADGRCFNRAWLIAAATDLQPLMHEGRYKRAGYHYPKSTIWNGKLVVAFTANKEDVMLASIPLSDVQAEKPASACD